jgi:hypothetical protein
MISKCEAETVEQIVGRCPSSNTGASLAGLPMPANGPLPMPRRARAGKIQRTPKTGERHDF